MIKATESQTSYTADALLQIIYRQNVVLNVQIFPQARKSVIKCHRHKKQKQLL